MLGKRSLYFKVPRLEGRGFLSFSALVIGALIGASALSVWAQTSGTWTAPTATPPGNNIAAPINVSTAPQAKSGLLGLSNFLFNPAWTSGSVATGSILTALDSDGTVGWGTAAVSSGSSSSGGGASIDYGDCTTIAYTEGGACSGSVAQGMCPTNYVAVGNTTGLRFPGGPCVNAQLNCRRLQSGGSGSSDPFTALKAKYGLQSWPSYVVCMNTTLTTPGAALVLMLEEVNLNLYRNIPGAAIAYVTAGTKLGQTIDALYNSSGAFQFTEPSSGDISCPTQLHLDSRITDMGSLGN